MKTLLSLHHHHQTIMWTLFVEYTLDEEIYYWFSSKDVTAPFEVTLKGYNGLRVYDNHSCLPRQGSTIFPEDKDRWEIDDVNNYERFLKLCMDKCEYMEKEFKTKQGDIDAMYLVLCI